MGTSINGPRVNEIVNLLHSFAPRALAELVSRHPAHEGILAPGLIAGEGRSKKLGIRLEASVTGLDVMLEIVPAIVGRLERRQRNFELLSMSALVATIAANLGVLALLGVAARPASIGVATGAALVFGLVTACIQWSGIVQREADGMRRLLRTKDLARRICVDLRAFDAPEDNADQIQALIAQANQIADEVREAAFEARVTAAVVARNEPIKVTAREALLRLLVDLFVTGDELCRWIWVGPDGDKLKNAIGWGASAVQCAADSVRVLEAWGYVDREMFQRLVESFPRRGAIVQKVARAWGYSVQVPR